MLGLPELARYFMLANNLSLPANASLLAHLSPPGSLGALVSPLGTGG